MEYVSATPEHAAYIAARLRAADREEVRASHGIPPELALQVSLRASTTAVCGLVDGEPAGIFGVVNVDTLQGVGAPWMLGTDKVDSLAREWLREAPQWLALLSDGYLLLRNWVDARNVKSIRWLRRLGFDVRPAEPRGVFGLAFHPFERRV